MEDMVLVLLPNTRRVLAASRVGCIVLEIMLEWGKDGYRKWTSSSVEEGHWKGNMVCIMYSITLLHSSKICHTIVFKLLPFCSWMLHITVQ